MYKYVILLALIGCPSPPTPATDYAAANSVPQYCQVVKYKIGQEGTGTEACAIECSYPRRHEMHSNPVSCDYYGEPVTRHTLNPHTLGARY
jgi:hypothetical protein